MADLPRLYWPYDEVRARREAGFPARFVFSAPWFRFQVDVLPSEVDRAEALADKIQKGKLGPNDLEEVTWMFSAVAKFPMAYQLPRPSSYGRDDAGVIEPKIKLASPKTAFESLIGSKSPSYLDSGWTWDAVAALNFCRTSEGYDPEAIFSVARRFHLLNDLENNRTAQLIEHVQSLKSDDSLFRRASALILRQNHYVTEKCDGTLRASLPLAKSAQLEVKKFIAAEAGHDRLLSRALLELGEKPENIPTVESVVNLMEVFRCSAERNLLAFAMITDIFERTSYHEKDPLATLLDEGGKPNASRYIDIHREINDLGEHENVALGFLQFLKPVDEAYAREALRLAELATLVVHNVSVETLNLILEQNSSTPLK